ncbi:FHA domain-containing protein [Hyalangium versicolor]|uniref:FHA domain-containing protein n=1 Tax=Hyalangium versicolor TaxID=2861190 RepID=UPI001CCFFAA9|nr:FHA domain-containing protein [Hyalangium versicolor]
MPTLVVRHPDGSETEHELSGELKIGRQDGNDLILSEGGVSRQHARVFVEGGKVMLEDLGSANGTYVDEERIEGATPLTPQSQVVLGDYALKLKAPARPASGAMRSRAPRSAPAPEVGSEEGAPRATRALPSVKPARPPGSALAKRERPAPSAAPAEGGGGGSGPVLRGLTGPWANKTYPLKNKLLVGRAPPAVVLLEDDSISRKHAEVERSPRGKVTLRDLGSANGTLLNGERLGQEPVELNPGDIIQFGMVELVFEAGDAAGAVPSRRDRGGAPARGDKGDPSDAPPANKRKKLLMVAGGAVGLLLVVGIVKQLTASPEVGPEVPGPAAPQADPQAELQELLSQCRSFASSDMGSEPQWDKAEQTCEKALNIDPINGEANTLIKRIKIEKEAAEHFAQGSKLLQRLKEEDALDVLKKIPKDSQYFRRAKIKVDEAMVQVRKRALDDCKRYLDENQGTAAVPRCDRYMGFWCQNISREELEPPLGFTLSLEGRIGKKQWRPKDKLFVRFLQARQRLDPKAEPWKCPVTDFGVTQIAEGPEGQVKKMFKDRYPNEYMTAAMFDYWGGRGNESMAKLQKVRSKLELASLHGQVDLLMQDVSNVEQLFKQGSSDLQAGDVEKAAEPFDEAMEVDKRLMGDLWERAPSFYRRNIQQDIAEKAYERGKDWAKREDQRRACRIWKIGFRFYKGNTDLIRVLSNVCSTMGTRMFSGARSCADFAEVAEWAVPGDGIEEKVAKKREELNCKQ